MPKHWYTNKALYERAKREVYAENPKHSAYRSMAVVRRYKQLGGNTLPRQTLPTKRSSASSSSSSSTTRWREERWLNLTPYAYGWVSSVLACPPCGTKHPKQIELDLPSVCRPSRRVSVRHTPPVLAQDLTRAQIRRAVAIKKRGRTIQWSKL